MLCIFAVIYATPLPISVLFFHALGFLLPSLFPLLPPSPLPRDLPLLHNRLALTLVVQRSLAFILVLLPVLHLAITRAVSDGAAGAHEEFVATLGCERLANLAAEGTALEVLLRDLGNDGIATVSGLLLVCLLNYVLVGLSEMKKRHHDSPRVIATKGLMYPCAGSEAVVICEIHVVSRW